MGGNGKRTRWKISWHRKQPTKKDPPNEFICPLSKALMFDPVVCSSGQTFERLCVRVCKDLNFVPVLVNGSRPDFSAVIPNLALKTTIQNWCSKSGSGYPDPPEYSKIESIIKPLMGSSSSSSSMVVSKNDENSLIRDSERDLLAGIGDDRRVLFSHAATELNHRTFYTDSSSEESVIANATPLLLPFTTRPSCFSYSSSPSTSSEFVSDEAASNILSGLSSNTLAASNISGISSNTLSEDEVFVSKMKSLDVFEQEQAVMLLRKTTRTNEEARVSLCTEKLLFALKSLLNSRYNVLQTNAVAALVNLSLEKSNKVKIVRAGIVPFLIEILKNGFDESKEHAAGVIFSLSIEDQNKTAIGVLGAMQPLLHELRSGTRCGRTDSALALYHLTLVQSNRVKLVRLGGVAVLLAAMKDAEVAGRVVLVVCNLAACPEGRAALLDANAVECIVGMLRKGGELGLGSESTRENCVAALYALSHGSLRFRGLARDAGAAQVVREVAEKGSERAREKARRVLAVLRGRDEEEEGEGEVDWEAVMKGGVTRARHHLVGRTIDEPNSTEF